MRLFLNLLLCDTAPSCWRWWLGAGVNPHRRRTKILRELTPENSSAGYSLVTAGPLSPHPPGFLCHTYPQINSPIRNLLTKVVLKAMTLHTISLAFKKKKNHPYHLRRAAVALPFLDTLCPLVPTRATAKGGLLCVCNFPLGTGAGTGRPVPQAGPFQCPVPFTQGQLAGFRQCFYLMFLKLI